MIRAPEMKRGEEENLTKMLPVEARVRNCRLVLRRPFNDPDPVYLLDSQGNVLREWEYVPSMGEVDDACKLLS